MRAHLVVLLSIAMPTIGCGPTVPTTGDGSLESFIEFKETLTEDEKQKVDKAVNFIGAHEFRKQKLDLSSREDWEKMSETSQKRIQWKTYDELIAEGEVAREWIDQNTPGDTSW